MTKTKRIMVSLSGDDIKKYDKVVDYLDSMLILPKESEVMKMALRSYYEQIIKEIGEEYDKQTPPPKKVGS